MRPELFWCRGDPIAPEGRAVAHAANGSYSETR